MNLKLEPYEEVQAACTNYKIKMQTYWKRATFASALLATHAIAAEISATFLCDVLATLGYDTDTCDA